VEAGGVAGHTFATQLVRNGANLRVVQELCRHESISTTARYTAVDEGERIRALQSLTSWTVGIPSDPA